MTIVGGFRFALGSIAMLGVAPEYLGIWLCWRAASLVMPGWLYQWGDDKLYSLYQRFILFFFETCTRVEVVMYGDAEEALKRRESVIYMGNHQSTVDWLVADMVAIRGGSLGHLRYVMKDTLQLIPLYGHYFYAHGCIYVKRGQFNQDKMIQSLDYLKHDKIPTWLVIFPEGTRYYPSTPKVIEKSEQFALDHNLEPKIKTNLFLSSGQNFARSNQKIGHKVLKHHLVPKIKGTWLAVKHLHKKFDAIYDVSVFYEGTVDKHGFRGNAPQLAAFLMGKCKKVHIHVHRIPMGEVPDNELELTEWLHSVYIEKDRLAENFFSQDSTKRAMFQSSFNGIVNSLSIWSTLSSFIFFSSLSIPFLLTSIGQKSYIQLLIYGTLGSYGWMAIRSVC